MYADDTVVFCSEKDVALITSTLNDQLDKIDALLRELSLFLNKSKTEAMLIGTHARLSAVENVNVNLGNNAIKRSLEFRYLGIVLDECLSWNAYVEYTADRA